MQCCVQFIKTVCTSAQPFCITAETKMFIHGFFDQVTQVFKIHGCDMFCFILRAHAAKGPFQIIKLGKTFCFGQKISFTNQVSKCRTLTLQKQHHSINGIYVIILQGNYPCSISGMFFLQIVNFCK